MQATVQPPAIPQTRAPRPVSKPRLSHAALAAAVEGPNLEALSLDSLRQAIRSNRVSFPSQIPVFPKHDRPDLQWKFAQLYFVFGWNCRAIASKYGLIRQRVQQVLNTWKRRAVQMGYLQFIPPADAVDMLFVEATHPSQAPHPALVAHNESRSFSALAPSAHAEAHDLLTRG